jgi:hypothetical protein
MIRQPEGDAMRHLVTFAAGFLTAALLFAVPALSQSVSPEAMTTAKELVVASGAADKFKAILPLLSQQLKPAIVQGRPEVERDYDKIMPLVIEAFNERIERILVAIAEIYARNFTIDEMRQVSAFYRTPIGQKLLEKTAVIAQQSMVVGNKFGQEIAQDLQTRMMEELRKRGHNI